MRIEDLIVYGKSQVHSDFAKMLLADLLNMNALELYNHLDDIVDDKIQKEYKKKLTLLKQNKPIQYVLGNVNFYGLSFVVDERVLIPRFETEELVENTILYIKRKFGNQAIKIIDLGCGSGVIGLTLKKYFPNADVTLLDISKDAIDVARINSERLQLSVSFVQGDMLEDITEKFHVIISNPPYIAEDEKIQSLVRNNEPTTALFGGKDGLDFYRKICKTCPKNLEKDFFIAFEIGWKQKDAIIKLVNSCFSNVFIECKKDLSMKDRMIFISSNQL